jgi:iron complex transport system permease protein
MNLDLVDIPAKYRQYISRKIFFLCGMVVSLVLASIAAISLGAADISFFAVAKSLLGFTTSRQVEMIVWNIRLPQVLAAIIAGAGLAIAGAVMQCILRNPLGSPFTLGISHAAAFGASLSVMLLGDDGIVTHSAGNVSIIHLYMTTAAAFICSIAASALIVGVTKIRGANAEVMILTGVALGAFCTAGTMFLQFFADDTQLAAMVFWTFGDTGRVSSQELLFIFVVTLFCLIWFFADSWNYNAINVGDETAKGLGVRVERVRLRGMLLSSILTAVIISFLGIIGFVGLVVPHMVRKIIGSDHRFLLPACTLVGAFLLLVSDVVARLLLAPHVLPVSVLTAFIGAPAFFWIILRRGSR